MARIQRSSRLLPIHSLISFRARSFLANSGLQRLSRLFVASLQVLQRLYADEWHNFMQRLQRKSVSFDELRADPHLGLQVRLWASLRGQTLARTVVGMQQYEAALRFTAEIEMGGDGDLAAEVQRPYRSRSCGHTHN
eukprot:4901957-Pleurochrysis_carterae.AAC.1